ncbi:MAG: hypothetical protein DI536_22205 [Archangium gephyra]|uniref:DUF3604 domain-containing protein n=1 Tax=Archangium gephyra TaxID=48 RepID=A0A2W5T5V0_9BACT|nr:MAG: hypothetical protein DI536_22205 [Archangium gephyra]
MRWLPLLVLVVGCTKVEEPMAPVTPWSPGVMLTQSHAVNARGFVELRGLIHVHSIYSHDACDGAPHDDNGVYDATCLEDFRRGACQTGDDFFFLTDHGDSFRDNEFPAVLLHDASRGDVLVTRGASASANRLMCPDGRTALIMAGTETGTMPVGLEAHAANRADYGSRDDAVLDAYRATLNGVTLVPHAEDWTVDQLIDLHLDGFEIFNLHRNALQNAGIAAELIFNYVEKQRFDELPHPDLFLAAFELDDREYMDKWGTVLSRGHQRVTTFGSDCHRNTFPQLMGDGERIDSYRRMMSAFSNHLLVKPKADGTWDDRDVKDALRSGRNYGVFEFLGYAEGFDVHAGDVELGGTASVGATITATMPTVRQLDPNVTPPALVMKLLRAKEQGWDEVASVTEGTLEYVSTQPGAYRVEVRMVPKHLLGFAGKRRDFFTKERPWVMSSALYVR